ncbi:MAG TPA: hypothetical protein VFG76_07970 [Candidatus Polarisedimenticolia bacterium]|nr:hypothetical protein [Candidatus Polarisedimenticolia bacterium]
MRLAIATLITLALALTLGTGQPADVAAKQKCLAKCYEKTGQERLECFKGCRGRDSSKF